MKITKIPGLGRFGVFVDDLDFNVLSDEEWHELGKAHLQHLVTIIRNVKTSPQKFSDWMHKWGHGRQTIYGMYHDKYPEWSGNFQDVMLNDIWEEEDKLSVSTYIRLLEPVKNSDGEITKTLLRVSGKRSKLNLPLGMFAEGELLWHSNESGNYAFVPGVALYAAENVTKSATGFMTTSDYYETVSESFRSELNEMILLHNFIPGRINPGLNSIQDNVMYKNMAPEKDAEIPLVVKSPGGILGLHYSFNTVTGIKGCSQKEAEKILTKIRKGLEVNKYTYDHWYQNDGDICIFDNSITQHRRLGETKDRLCYRYQFDYSCLQNDFWMPYLQEPYQSRYVDRITRVVKNLKIPNFKLPGKEVT